MTLEQLRVFATIAETLHFTNAAKKLRVAQSGVSSAISALEHRHHLRLFDRVGRRVELTQAGARFLPIATAVLEQAAAAERLLLDLTERSYGELRLSSSQTVASYWLPRHLVAMRRRHPTIKIALAVQSTAKTEEAVLGGTADLGFVEGPVASRLLREFEIARDQMAMVAAPEHPWAKEKRLQPSDLTKGEWVLRERGSGTRLFLNEYLRGVGIRPESLDVALELPTNESVRAAVEAGLGATVLSMSIVAASLDEGLLKTLPIPLPSRAFYVISHRERALTRASEALLNLSVGASAST